MKKVLIGLLIIVALVVGINLFEDNAQPKQTQVYSLSDYAYTELENGIIYRAEDLMVVDTFAKQEHKVNGKVTATTDYYVVIFWDKNDQLTAAMLSVEDDDDIHSKLFRYVIDETQSIGDCVLDGYVKTVKNTNTELTQYFEESLSEYGAVLDKFIARPQWMFKYHCNALEDPLK